MFSLRTHAIICASLFGALLLLAIGGNALIASGMVKQPTTPSVPVMILFFALTIAFAFSAVPVMVKLVLRGHAAMGNEGAPIIRDLVRSQTLIIWLIWALMALGSAIAIPAAIMDGAFR